MLYDTVLQDTADLEQGHYLGEPDLVTRALKSRALSPAEEGEARGICVSITSKHEKVSTQFLKMEGATWTGA